MRIYSFCIPFASFRWRARFIMHYACVILLGVYIIAVISTRVKPTRCAAYCNILYFISRLASVARDRENKRDSGGRWLYNSVNVYILLLLLLLYRLVHCIIMRVLLLLLLLLPVH